MLHSRPGSPIPPYAGPVALSNLPEPLVFQEDRGDETLPSSLCPGSCFCGPLAGAYHFDVLLRNEFQLAFYAPQSVRQVFVFPSEPLVFIQQRLVLTFSFPQALQLERYLLHHVSLYRT